MCVFCCQRRYQLFLHCKLCCQAELSCTGVLQGSGSCVVCVLCVVSAAAAAAVVCRLQLAPQLSVDW